MRFCCRAASRSPAACEISVYNVVAGKFPSIFMACWRGMGAPTTYCWPTAIASWSRRLGRPSPWPAGSAGRRSTKWHRGRGPSVASNLLSLAGGLEVRGKYRLAILHILPDGRSEMTAVGGQSGVLHDSEALFAQPAANQTISQATLSGGMTLAGPYSLKNTKLSDVLKAPGALGDNPYTLFGSFRARTQRRVCATSSRSRRLPYSMAGMTWSCRATISSVLSRRTSHRCCSRL